MASQPVAYWRLDGLLPGDVAVDEIGTQNGEYVNPKVEEAQG